MPLHVHRLTIAQPRQELRGYMRATDSQHMDSSTFVPDVLHPKREGDAVSLWLALLVVELHFAGIAHHGIEVDP